MSDKYLEYEKEIFKEFKGKEFNYHLFNMTLDTLQEKCTDSSQEPWGKEDTDANFKIYDRLLHRYMENRYAQEPRITARKISANATLLMHKRYMIWREGGTDHCTSLINSQNEFIEVAYDVAKGQDSTISGLVDYEYIEDVTKDLTHSFEYCKEFVGDTPEHFARLLSELTYHALKQTHKNCTGLDENLSLLKDKYPINPLLS